MKPIEEHMAFYEAYHRHPLNKLTHFVGIPVIVFSLLVLLSAISFPVAGTPVTPAMLVVAVLLGYYLVLQPAFGVGMALFLVPSLVLAHRLGQGSWLVALGLFAALFVVGWFFQLLGHGLFEKRRPALVDNLFQLIIGPVFLVAEVFFFLGYRPSLHERIRELSAKHDRIG